MAASYQTLPANKRHCPFCGVLIAMNLSQCPSCREAVPPVSVAYRSSPDGRRAIRRGLLYMLLAAVAYYFASGYGGYSLPIQVKPLVTDYLLPVLFLAGLGLSLYGAFQRIRA
ncbi:MAG: hypothetical protein AUH88_03490 [Acidobacteria bacterium 13_1_40CM_4_61_5]|nr:MAG: hypothetical protein AUH88_03490 [Acidobacteria bacterium 13_1_40CM_4_61_5]PYU06767.1 MAG: hypothetical protein DMG33_06890 [Acidobacteriota bacterium]